MRFRARLLILLLITALVPLSLSFMSQRSAVIRFGNKLAGDTRELLNNGAVNLLHAQVDDYARILERDRSIAMLALQAQAQAVENRLASPPPPAGTDFYLASDFSNPALQPRDLTPSYKHQRPKDDGSFEAIPVSYSQQVVFLTRGTQLEKVKQQVMQLSSMNQIYHDLHQIQPELFLWQYTALGSGVHFSYPAKGGYPEGYDPRKREWYLKAVIHDAPVQQMINDLTTRALILTLAMPVHLPGGRIAGVTAIDIDYRQFFRDWSIPSEWADIAESMILIYDENSADEEHKLEILLRSSQNRISDWQTPVEHNYLDLNDSEMDEVKRDIGNGISAVRRLTYRGQDVLMAYGVRNGSNPFPLVIVPYQRILDRANDAELYINSQMSQGLRTSALLTIAVVLAAIILGFIRSRRVTRPLAQLTEAAENLSTGNFDTKVHIESRDEFADLGQVFNQLGERLKERNQLKQSLALAKEIQQQLLPQEIPSYPGFELTGRSIYCDETGGDYYDFIQLNDTEQQRIGIAVGDVSGHGIGPALVMSTTRGALHTLSDHYSKDLNRLFRDLNRHLCRSTSDAFFMTLFYAILTPETGTVQWLSAGHAPTFLYQQGKIHQLQSSGIPLGIVCPTDFDKTQEIVMTSGDILLIGTDGIWETINSRGEMFGTEELVRLIRHNAQLSADALATLIIDNLNLFKERESQTDDVTLVIIKAL